jgi:hypothetical protein
LKRITRCKLALIFTSADHRKFLGWFGSEAARLKTSNEAPLEVYVIKMFLFCLYMCLITVTEYLNFFVADRKFKCNFSHTVIMSSFSLKGYNAMISRTAKLLEIYDLDAPEP